MVLEGTVQRSPMGPGVWVLVTPESQTYQLYRPAKSLLQEGLAVRATGRIRDDVMTVAMVGPVFEVQDFELL
jgi:hypothetical protein